LTFGNHLTPKEASEQLEQIPIIHLHGMLGLLPHIRGTGRDYSAGLNPDVIRIAADGIKIVHEVQPDKEFQQAKQLIDDAQDIVFLGFGYLETNIERLQALPSDSPEEPRQWFGSAYGLGEGEKQILGQRFFQRLQLANRQDDCLETLKRFSVLV
jgi:hypothetical protein